MRWLVGFVAVLTCVTTLWAVSESVLRESPRESGIDRTIAELYAVISGPAGARRDWDRMRGLFLPDARMMSVRPVPEGKSVVRRAMTVDQYIEGGQRWFANNGFFEREVSREVRRYGDIADVFSTYECFRAADETEPFLRGINSIQFVFDGERWRVLSLVWQAESEKLPIPERYLRASDGK